MPAPDTDATGDRGPTGDLDAFSARANLPFPGLERATSVLRGQLRAMSDHALAGGPVPIPDWDTLTVEGPDEQPDPDGRNWFTYTATVRTRPRRLLDPPAAMAPHPVDAGT